MIAAGYFDGKTAKRHEVMLTVHQDGIRIVGDGVASDLPWTSMTLSERGRHGPRVIETRDGARCEIDDTSAFNEELRRYRRADGWVVRLQQSWSSVFATLLVGIALVIAGYVWGLPWLADRASHVVPTAIVDELSAQGLASLDRLGMKPSTVPEARRSELERKLRDLLPPEVAQATLHFRSGGKLGANALALPSGDIVVTDELIALTQGNDDLVLAVLAHELGHVAHRHGLRNVLQASAIGILATLYLGDASAVLSGVATLGLTLSYSRGFEEDADDYAANLLRANGLAPSLLVVMLERLDGDHREGLDNSGESASELLRSHPGTARRVQRLLAHEGRAQGS